MIIRYDVIDKIIIKYYIIFNNIKNTHEKSLVGYFHKLQNDPFNVQKH